MAFLLALGAQAQSGTNSPYSQYGIGLLSDASQGFSRGMNGAGIGLRKGNIANTLNPASYSAVDSLTMIFDMGVSGQITNFKEGATSINARNTNFEYAVGSFRLFPKVGMSFGILPFSNVGYKYQSSSYLDSANGTITKTYNGSGGYRQAFIGAGWLLGRHLSIGANVSYLWGTTERTIQTSSTTSINSLKKDYKATVSSYKVDLGMQWQQRLNAKNTLTLGATLGLGHKLGATPTCEIININAADTTTFQVENGLALPVSYGVGLALSHDSKLIIDADFTLQKWGKIDFPAESAGTNGDYALRSGLLKDRYQVKIGVDYVPNETDVRKFLNRIHYRCGIGYATPYYYINGKEGPKELSASAGFGIPLQNVYNNRSVLNISAQWTRTAATGMIKENTFRINIGLTFNERWFAKWKIE